MTPPTRDRHGTYERLRYGWAAFAYDGRESSPFVTLYGAKAWARSGRPDMRQSRRSMFRLLSDCDIRTHACPWRVIRDRIRRGDYDASGLYEGDGAGPRERAGFRAFIENEARRRV